MGPFTPKSSMTITRQVQETHELDTGALMMLQHWAKDVKPGISYNEDVGTVITVYLSTLFRCSPYEADRALLDWYGRNYDDMDD